MLRIQPVVIEWIRSLRPVVESVRRHDRHLADQLARSCVSVGLNLAEGAGACGGDKRRSYRIALREMRESTAAIEMACALGYAKPMNAGDDDRQERIVATLVRLAKPA